MDEHAHSHSTLSTVPTDRSGEAPFAQVVRSLHPRVGGWAVKQNAQKNRSILATLLLQIQEPHKCLLRNADCNFKHYSRSCFDQGRFGIIDLCNPKLKLKLKLGHRNGELQLRKLYFGGGPRKERLRDGTLVTALTSTSTSTSYRS